MKRSGRPAEQQSGSARGASGACACGRATMLRNALLVFLSSVVAISLIELLLVLEPGLQAENPPETHVFCEGPPRRLRPHIVLGATEAPDSAYFERKTEADGWAVHIYNEDGFRDVFNTGNRHVIVLGDSFTRGTLVNNDETFAYLLDLWHPDVAFHNFGTGGYATGDAYRLYRSVARSIDHDLVVLGYFVGNDLLENLRYDPARASGDRRPPASPADGQSGTAEHGSALLKLHVLLRIHSRAYSLVYMTLKKALHGAHPSLIMSAPARGHALDVTRMILEDLIAEASSNGADLLVVILPYWNEIVDPDAGRFADLQRSLISDLAGRHDHVHSLDLLDVILAAGPETTFGEVDKHFNRYGQYLTALAIHDWINGSWRRGPLAVGQVPPFDPDRPPVVPDCGVLERYRQSFERQADLVRGDRGNASATRP
jgi:hypothetical protein